LYNVSKGGINTFIKSFAIKVAPDIRVIGIAPGITENTRMTLGRKNDDLDRIRATIPLKRFANVDEIAALTFSLLSDAGSYMTGSVVDVNEYSKYPWNWPNF
jgi:NAD(P)-dependent dehydrogenase (short-subunit alcohol dehydrogenase family)